MARPEQPGGECSPPPAKKVREAEEDDSDDDEDNKFAGNLDLRPRRRMWRQLISCAGQNAGWKSPWDEIIEEALAGALDTATMSPQSGREIELLLERRMWRTLYLECANEYKFATVCKTLRKSACREAEKF